MPDDAPFDPCRAWLGVDAADLVAPHLVLGVAATETDPLVIVRAADRRLTDLRGVEPGAFASVRDALLKRVEECRDAMLAGAVAARSLGAQPAPAAALRSPPPPATPSPPAPPPPPTPAPAEAVREPPQPAAAPHVDAAFPRLHPPPPPSTLVVSGRNADWPTVPASGPVAPPPVPTPLAAPSVPPGVDSAEPAVSFAAHARVPRRPVQRKDGGGGGLVATIIGLTAVAAALALYVLWPQLTQKAGGGRTVAVATPTPQPPTPQPPTPQPTPQPEPSPPPPTLPPTPPPTPKPEPPSPQPSPPPRPSPQPEPPPQPSPFDEVPNPGTTPTPPPEPPPMVDPAEVRARAAQAVGTAWKAIRRGEFDTANRALAAAADVAGDDQASSDRVSAWQQFATYAQEFPGYRDQALAAAAAGREYVVAGRPVAVVEVRPDVLIYRDRGRNVTVPRDGIPPPLEIAIVAAWFAADGRAANHLFLGAAHLCSDPPDLAAARGEWQQAAQGGEADGNRLLRLLDDPVLRGD